MHIAYVHQYFATPNGSTGTRSYEFARRWVAAGHRVTMLTSTAQLTPEDVPGGDLERRCEFDVSGIHVIAWPIRYKDLAPYYDRAEQLMGVCGGTDDSDVLPGSRVLMPPPNPRCGEVFLRKACDKLGIPMVAGRRAKGFAVVRSHHHNRVVEYAPLLQLLQELA